MSKGYNNVSRQQQHGMLFIQKKKKRETYYIAYGHVRQNPR